MKNHLIYIFSFDTNIASHRLRLAAAQIALDAEVVSVTSKNIFSLVYVKAVSICASFSLGSPRLIRGKAEFFLASKPFSIQSLFISFVCKYLLNLAFVVDISDNHLLKLKGLRHTSLLFRQYISFCLASKISCPTITILASIPMVFRHKVFVIEDLIDYESVCDCPYIIFSKFRSRRLVWFGHAGIVNNVGVFQPSESIAALKRFLNEATKVDISNNGDLFRDKSLVICSNHPVKVAEYFSCFQGKFSVINCVAWSPSEIRVQLKLAGGVLLTYSSSRLSSGKSSNRPQTSLISGLPTLVIDPPPSCQELHSTLLKLAPSLPLLVCDQKDFAERVKEFFDFLSEDVPYSQRDLSIVRAHFYRRNEVALTKWKKMLFNAI